jgi:signal peptidase
MHSMGGYSWFHVVSSSMQKEIPKGSIVFVKKTDPQKIKAGDVITYQMNNGSTVTHAVVEIIDSGGFRGFRTKGTSNKEPDPEIVSAEKVIGVVSFHIAGIGAVLAGLAKWFVCILAVALVLASLFVRLRIAGKDSFRAGPRPGRIFKEEIGDFQR